MRNCKSFVSSTECVQAQWIGWEESQGHTSCMYLYINCICIYIYIYTHTHFVCVCFRVICLSTFLLCLLCISLLSGCPSATQLTMSHWAKAPRESFASTFLRWFHRSCGQTPMMAESGFIYNAIHIFVNQPVVTCCH